MKKVRNMITLYKFPIKATLFYILLGGSWTIFFEQFLQSIIDVESKFHTILHFINDWIYIIITAIILFSLLSIGIFHERKQSLKDLESSRERYRKIVEMSPDAILVHSEEGIIFANSHFVQLIKAESYNQLIGKPFLEIFPPSYREIAKSNIDNLFKNRKIGDFLDVPILCLDGTVIEAEAIATAISYNNQIAMQVIIRDESERKQYEKALIESEARYKLIAENSSDLIQLIDFDGIVTYASPSHLNIMGHAPEEYIGKWIFYQPNKEDDHEFQNEYMQMVMKKKPFTLDLYRQHKNGHYLWINVIVSPLLDEDGNVKKMLLVAREITDRKNHEKQLEHLAFHDSLTTLPNRRMFELFLEREIANAEREGNPLAVMYLDCDNFKEINDTLGHEAGDLVLQQFAQRLQSCIRKGDVAARFGGDEFTILLPRIHNEYEVANIAQRIIESIRDPLQIGEHNVQITTSIGIALYPNDGLTVQEIVNNADAILYTVKENGRDNFQFYSATEKQNCS